MRALNPDQLRTFIEVVELGSFTAAAKRLSLSQPAVSLQVRELEARCGVQLLDRHSKKPFPTEAGRQMLVHAGRILREHEDALVAMQRINEKSGHAVRLGMTMTTLTYLARDAVRRLKRDFPEIDLSVVLSSSHRLADDVRNHNLDLAIVTLPLDESHLKVEVFHEDTVAGIVPEDLFPIPPDVLTPQLMAAAPFVTQSLGDVQTTLADGWLRDNGYTAQSYLEVRNLEACRAAVAAGLGVSIVPGMMASHPMAGLLTLPLDPPVIRRMAVIEHEHRTVTPVSDQVRKAMLHCGRDQQKTVRASMVTPPAVAPMAVVMAKNASPASKLRQA